MTTPNSFLDRFSRHFTKTDRIAAACAALYWLVYCILGLDLQFFEFKHTKYRLVFLCLLILLAIVLVRLFRRAFVEKDTFSRRFLLYTGINLAILSVFLLLLWPGTWSWDDIGVLNGSIVYTLAGWQHFLSYLAMIFSAYLIPSAGGIVFVQTVIIAFISGYVLAIFDTYFLANTKRSHAVALVIADLVFFLPPILIYDYSKFRSTLCSYLEILLFALVIRISKTSPLLSKKNLLFLTIIIIIVASWRSENFYYAPLTFFFLLFILGSKRWKVCLFVAASTCALVVGIGQYNTYLIGTNNYSVMAIINQVTTLVRNIPKDTEGYPEDQINQIAKVLDIERIITETDKTGSVLYWDGATLDYSESDYKEFLQGYFGLISRYPTLFLQERFSMFWNTLGFNDLQYTPVDHSIQIYHPGNDFSDAWGTNRPALNVSVRESTLRFLGGETNTGARTTFYHIFWNILPPMLFAISAMAIFFFKGKYLLSFLCFSNVCKIPLIFLTAPDTYFMYYLSIYLFGYLIFFFTLALLFNRKCKRKEPMVS